LPVHDIDVSFDLEEWARAYVAATTLQEKLAPRAAPRAMASGAAVRLSAPGRPPELRVASGRTRLPTSAASLRDPRRRAQLLHVFFHHELQAAELMCWAILAFPDAPPAFRRGLAAIAEDEARHARMYADAIGRLGARVGDFEVNDWFWSRVPRAETPAAFVATLGIGFEGGNLDHGARFATRLREAGDAGAAEVQARIAEEEVPHVAFAAHWFERFAGELGFDTWRAHLVAPLTPTVMRGRPLDVAARARAGLPDELVARLSTW